ncbi:hypothetical protein U1Q18_022382, partial [Sarracenia purpurea var. burkii]
MAPRKKPNRGASISFDQFRFSSKAAEERYNASYANRPIRIEQNIQISDFADTPVSQWFEDRWWTSVLGASGE